jgi:hypothetical protein
LWDLWPLGSLSGQAVLPKLLKLAIGQVGTTVPAHCAGLSNEKFAAPAKDGSGDYC